ncbi:uncharacterized protein LOC133248405 isoform X1 [Bos javanicus]|uniref:uncharacterized protein LOC133248405 isoform X1 n=1 Tax=Bos javanicus TaxID=9906 RepID=UPI002AA80B91|nr:uncharacterized protein LOC133248405 isoform X1 [Bos javanicus]
MELWNRRRRCWMKLEMERAGLERPFPAVTQPPQSRLGRERRQSRLGRERRLSRQRWETPSGVQGPQSWMEGQSRAYVKGEVLWTSQRSQSHQHLFRPPEDGLKKQLQRGHARGASGKNQRVLWSQDLTGGFLFPSPHRTQEGNGVAAEVTRFQGHLLRGGGNLVQGGCTSPACLCACVGVRARVLKLRVRGPCVRVYAVRARVPRVCTGVAAAAGARPGRGSACPSLCAPARPPERSIASGQECACVGMPHKVCDVITPALEEVTPAVAWVLNTHLWSTEPPPCWEEAQPAHIDQVEEPRENRRRREMPSQPTAATGCSCMRDPKPDHLAKPIPNS